MKTELHQETKYVDNLGRAQQLINDPRFKTMSQINEDLFEVNLSKKNIATDLSIQIGYTILQLAKLRLLEFYYDFLRKDCDPKRFQMTEYDTNSNYMQINGPDIYSIMRIEEIRNRDEFKRTTDSKYCRDDIDFTPEQGFFLPRVCREIGTNLRRRQIPNIAVTTLTLPLSKAFSFPGCVVTNTIHMTPAEWVYSTKKQREQR